MRKNTRKSAAKAALALPAEGIDVLVELAALKAMTVPELQGKWRVMFGEHAPNASRGNLELRIGYRIQELAYGGIKPVDAPHAGRAGGRGRLGRAGAADRGSPPPDPRHQAGARVAGRGTGRHRADRRLRMAGAALQVALGRGARDHRQSLERVEVLRTGPWRGERRLRCAIYTRKSSEEGLDMEFNSLDAQREACEAYIASQRAEGWVRCATAMTMAASPAARWSAPR
jgi:hypothetical protein